MYNIQKCTITQCTILSVELDEHYKVHSITEPEPRPRNRGLSMFQKHLMGSSYFPAKSSIILASNNPNRLHLFCTSIYTESPRNTLQCPTSPLNITFVRFIHADCFIAVHLFSWLHCLTLYEYIQIIFILSTVDEHLGSFQFGDITNSSARYNLVHVFW